MLHDYASQQKRSQSRWVDFPKETCLLRKTEYERNDFDSHNRAKEET